METICNCKVLWWFKMLHARINHAQVWRSFSRNTQLVSAKKKKTPLVQGSHHILYRCVPLTEWCTALKCAGTHLAPPLKIKRRLLTSNSCHLWLWKSRLYLDWGPADIRVGVCLRVGISSHDSSSGLWWGGNGPVSCWLSIVKHWLRK